MSWLESYMFWVEAYMFLVETFSFSFERSMATVHRYLCLRTTWENEEHLHCRVYCAECLRSKLHNPSVVYYIHFTTTTELDWTGLDYWTTRLDWITGRDGLEKAHYFFIIIFFIN